ncbi:MAG TPA: hypothetical protein PLO65_14240, partial [Caulobacter sp.]|nr:hypothetical protein [Caulobacter sp.]
MIAPPPLPDPASHPGLRLMEATAAVLRGAQAAPRPADVVGGAFLEGETPVPLSDGAADQVLARIAGLEAIDARA